MESAGDKRRMRRAHMTVYIGSIVALAVFAATLCGFIFTGTSTTDGRPPAPPLLQNTSAFGVASVWTLPVKKSSYAQRLSLRDSLVAAVNASRLVSQGAIAQIMGLPIFAAPPSPRASIPTRASRAPSSGSPSP